MTHSHITWTDKNKWKQSGGGKATYPLWHLSGREDSHLALEGQSLLKWEHSKSLKKRTPAKPKGLRWSWEGWRTLAQMILLWLAVSRQDRQPSKIMPQKGLTHAKEPEKANKASVGCGLLCTKAPKPHLEQEASLSKGPRRAFSAHQSPFASTLSLWSVQLK